MKQKRTYRKVPRTRKTRAGWVEHPMVFEPINFYIRNIQTFQEIREAEADRVDSREARTDLKIRKARAGQSINSWNLERRVTMAFKRSWKRFYKCKKQWGVNK